MIHYLNSLDDEPPVGTQVINDEGVIWEHQPEGYWLRDDSPDPESWVKIAGNYGPVRVLE